MRTPPGRLGVWSFIDGMTAVQAAAFARRLEGWGYGALWLPEAVGRDPFTTIAWLAANSERLVFATMSNGVRQPRQYARRLQDQMLEILVSSWR